MATVKLVNYNGQILRSVVTDSANPVAWALSHFAYEIKNLKEQVINKTIRIIVSK